MSQCICSKTCDCNCYYADDIKAIVRELNKYRSKKESKLGLAGAYLNVVALIQDYEQAKKTIEKLTKKRQ